MEATKLQELPRYSIAEASRYLHISETTLRSWIVGRPYPVRAGQETRYFEPLITRPDAEDTRLSFSNLVEAHVLRALRFKHEVRMQAVREALDYAERHFSVSRLLLSDELRAAPGRMFLDRYGELIQISESGQHVIRQYFEAHLERLDRDVRGIPIRLFPVSRVSGVLTSPKVIVIDPRISFGRPVIDRAGIKTSTIVERFDAGESMGEIAKDYDIELPDVEEAIRYERAA